MSQDDTTSQRPDPLTPRPLASPCIGVCQIDTTTKVCMGCLRDLDEIAYWGKADHARRVEIIGNIKDRREKLGLGNARTASANSRRRSRQKPPAPTRD
jgi:predicted Fe-S protein YdhL (DUF1289 family)